MSKMRVYEYAKQHELTSKIVIKELKKLNFEVGNHMSSIDKDAIAELNKVFRISTGKEETSSGKKSAKGETTKQTSKTTSAKQEQPKKQEAKKQTKDKKQKSKHQPQKKQSSKQSRKGSRPVTDKKEPLVSKETPEHIDRKNVV